MTTMTKNEVRAFSVLKRAVAKQFEQMRPHGLFRVDVAKDLLWATYLAAFPEGTNPLYRERTEHDCTCCRQFVRVMGGVCAIVDGQLMSIWDVEQTGTAYDVVASALTALVRDAVVQEPFFHTEKTVGTEKTFEAVLDSGAMTATRTWEHFHLRLPDACVAVGKGIGPRLADARATHDVMARSLQEITMDAVDSVLELIAQNSLYRGEEQKFAVEEFRKLKAAYGVEDDTRPSGVDIGPEVLKIADKLYGVLGSRDAELDRARDLFIWERQASIAASVARIRNTAVGTLLTDLSEGRDLEDAVSAFELKVAPANYKRPTALVTKAMIAKAKETLAGLGLTSALERRYAVLEDVSAADALFVDRGARRKALGSDVFEDLSSSTPERGRKLYRVEEVPVAKFLADVLPRAATLEVLLENRHAGNLVSLVAPADPGAGKLFKWPNGFSWSYAGDLADSIKERVKRAGGKVDGDFRASLSWYNYDDLDLHLIEPLSKAYEHRLGAGYRNDGVGREIYYANRISLQDTGGQLDVDMNAGGGSSGHGTRNAVENIFYPDKAKMLEGAYKLVVHNYRKMESQDVGFEVELEFDGVVRQFAYAKPVKDGERVTVAEFTYSRKDGVKIVDSLPSTQTSKNLWGLQTQTFCKVSLLTLSPNYWGLDNAVYERQGSGGVKAGQREFAGVGNRHWLFMLDGCRNEGTARGFYNEFLAAELEPHRKVFEMVGARMRAEEADRQLSGLGFSSTKRDSVTVRVGGATTRVVKVMF